MRDFPLNDLLVAYDLTKIDQSIMNIFNHLRKIRLSRYPYSRFFKFIECISRDLSNQILKVRIYDFRPSITFTYK